MINKARRTTLSASGQVVTIDATGATEGNLEEYVYNGTGTLSGSITISPLANLTAGVTYKIKIRYNATFELDGNSITIFSQVLTADQARGGNTIFDCQYIGGAWTVHADNDASIDERGNEGVLVTTLTGAGGTVTLNPRTDYQTQELRGSGTLIANYVYQAGGSPVNGDKFKVIYNATFAATGSDITIFGYTLTQAEIENGGVTVITEYNGSSWTTDAYRNPFLAVSNDMINKEISFITAEQCENYMLVPYAFTVTGTRAMVTDAIAGGDAQIDIYINSVLIADGALTIPDASPVDTTITNTPTAFFTGDANSILRFRTTTSGATSGRAFCQLIIVKT